MKLADAYRDMKIKFHDTFEPGVRVVHATKRGKTGVGRESWPPPRDEKGHIIPRGCQATQQAVDDLEKKLGMT